MERIESHDEFVRLVRTTERVEVSAQVGDLEFYVPLSRKLALEIGAELEDHGQFEDVVIEGQVSGGHLYLGGEGMPAVAM